MVDLEKAIIKETRKMLDESIDLRHDVYLGELSLLLMDLQRIENDYYHGLCDKATYCIESEQRLRKFCIWQEFEYPKF